MNEYEKFKEQRIININYIAMAKLTLTKNITRINLPVGLWIYDTVALHANFPLSILQVTII